MFKHFIEINNKNFITDYFSEAFREDETGICIKTEGGRHVNILGIINPDLKIGELYLYKYENDIIYKLTDEEIELQKKESEEYIRQLRVEEFKLIDKYQLMLVYLELTEEQRLELSDYRNAWRDAPETKLIPKRPVWLI